MTKVGDSTPGAPVTAREDPAAEATEFLLPPLVNRIPESTAGLRVRIRGRSVLLRRLRRPPTGIMRWVAAFGPGLITGAAANDAGGIATFSQLGAKFGYELLWVLVLSTISLAIVQEMCARLGAATGRGLLDLIRERFGLGWAIFIIGVVLLANGSLVVTEFAGVSAGAELLGVSRFAAVPVAAALIWYLVVAGTYGWVEPSVITSMVWKSNEGTHAPRWTRSPRSGSSRPVPPGGESSTTPL